MHTNHIIKDLFIISNKLRRTLDKEHQKSGIYLGQARVLRFMDMCVKEPVYQKNIEEALAIRGASVTGLIDGLVKDGLLTREGSTIDKRRKKISLTELGKKRAKEARDVVLKFEDELASLFTKEELKNFEDTTIRINNFLDEREKN